MNWRHSLQRCAGKTSTIRPLIEVLRAVPEVRQSQGKRRPLDAIPALARAAMLCGARSSSAMAEWGRTYDPAVVRALGFAHPPPCVATVDYVLRRLDHADLDARLGAWPQQVLAATGSRAAGPAALEPVAVDGKTPLQPAPPSRPDQAPPSGFPLSHHGIPWNGARVGRTAPRSVPTGLLSGGRRFDVYDGRSCISSRRHP